MKRTLSLLGAALCLLPAWAQAVTCQNNIPPSNPDSIYTNHGNGTVTDTRTGLMWKQCVEGLSGANCSTGSATPMTWAAALGAAATNNAANSGAGFANHTDWRLPNLKELRSLVEECKTNPSINDTVFPGTPASDVWSGSPSAYDSYYAWNVYFNSGVAYYDYRNGNYRVRLVRAGQSFAPLPALSAVALQGTPTANSAHFAGTSSLAGQGHWVVVPAGSAAPTAAQTKAGSSYGGVTVAGSGNTAMVLNTPQTFVASGLTASTGYDFYLVVESGGQLSAPPQKVNFSTATAPVAVNGACGSAHSAASATAPAANLCSAGTATVVTGSSGAWGWSCNGSGGGSSATCSAPYASQSLSIGASPASMLVGATSTITASSKVGLAVTLTGNANCSVSGTTATGTAAGTCTVTASQAGTGDAGASRYLAAVSVTTLITINALPSGATLVLPEGPLVGQPLVVAPPSNGWVLDSASTQTVASIGTPLPNGVSMPHGLVNLRLVGGASGTSTSVVLTYPQVLPAGARYYKYGRTATNPQPHWYEYPGAAISGNTITLTLTDGADGDDDRIANSTIVDPGGPAWMGAASIPTLGEWALALLAGVLGLVTMGALRRRS